MSNKTLAQIAEETALQYTLPVGVVSGLLAFLFNFSYPQLPILHAFHSIAFPIIILSSFLTLGFFIYGYLKGIRIKLKLLKLKVSERRIRFFSITLGIFFACFIGVFSTVLAVLFDNIFIGLMLDHYISSIIAGVFCSIVVYSMIPVAIQLGTNDLVTYLGIFLIGGVTISMLTVQEPFWWEKNFSFLGTVESGSFLIFNVTLILSALVLLLVIEYVFEGHRKAILSYKKVRPDRYDWTKMIFIFLALTFGGVGMFPWVQDTVFATLHNVSVILLAMGLFVIMLAIKWLIPIFPKNFYLNTYIILGAFAVAGILYSFVGYFNQTAYELLCFFIAAIWTLLFMRNMELLATEKNKTILTF